MIINYVNTSFGYRERLDSLVLQHISQDLITQLTMLKEDIIQSSYGNGDMSTDDALIIIEINGYINQCKD